MSKELALLIIEYVVATLASVAGLCFSYDKDLPMGASIVCALGAALLLVGVISRLLSSRRRLLSSGVNGGDLGSTATPAERLPRK